MHLLKWTSGRHERQYQMSAGISQTISIKREGDGSGFVDGDIKCLHCGYNLRTLRYESNCPECGMAVSVSLRRDFLSLAPAAWVDRLKLGAKALYVGLWTSIPFVVPGLIVAVWGLYQLTAKQPGRVEPAFDQTHRMVTRMCLVVGMTMMAAVVGMGVVMFMQHKWIIWQASQVVDFFFGIALSLIVIGLLNAWYYLIAIAGRLPDMQLVGRIRRLQRRWYVALGIGLALAVYVAASNHLHHLFPLLDMRVAVYGIELWALVAASILSAILLWLWWHTLRIAKQIYAAMINDQ